MKSAKPKCNILFSDKPGNTHVCQILAGYKMLQQQGLIMIESVKPCGDFRSDGHYEHNGIVEVDFEGRILAYDLADGYQSIHRKDVFDAQLERPQFYFKRSCNSDFHKDMKNRDKVKPLGLNYLCTCKNNPYDGFYFNNNAGISEIRRFATHLHTRNTDKFLYSQFESDGKSYDEYNLLFLTRLWDYTSFSAEKMKKIYPYFSDTEARAEAEKWKSSLENATNSRIEYIRALREYYGDRIVSGVSRDAFSEKICPELIVPDEITERNAYLKTIKKNYICITSEGLHHSIGWKFAEYVAAGKAIVTEPLYYEVPFGFLEKRNYIVYDDVGSLISKCDYLLDNVSKVHSMEENNRKYYAEHLRPDMLVKDTLIQAGIL